MLKFQTRTENENKLRAYPIRGYDVPYWGVTSILSYVFGIPPELNKWSVKVAMGEVFKAEKIAKAEGKKLTQKERIEIAQAARVNYLKEAQVKGTTVHDYIENKIKTGEDPAELHPEYGGYYQGFSRFLSEYQIDPILQEIRVSCDHHRYAGRIDFYGKIVIGGVEVLALIDFKTSNFLKDDYGLQLAAYKHALEDMGHKVDATYILHLKSNGTYQLVEYKEDFKNFVNVREVFRWKAQHAKPEYYWATDEGALAAELATDGSVVSVEQTG